MSLHDYESETRRIEREAKEFPRLSRFAGSPEDSGEIEPVSKECDWTALALLSLVALMASATACAFIWRMFA
jgi:hypothetical protein